MVEHLFCKQAVAGSNPIAGSISTISAGLTTPHKTTAARTPFSMPDGVMVAQQILTLLV